ncbi:hypothetical protein ASE75_09530 [Sphingomonas sp. Leaf17]|nr:hypothetical protein ASE75_09530 [Sphingomonas sp. Leaf17]
MAQTAPPAPAPAKPAAAAPDILQKAINVPGANWSFYGATQTSKAVKSDGVPGGQAVRVTVKEKGANAWDVGGSSPVQKGIAAGDTILVAVYLRAPMLKDGETTPIAFLGATDSVEPYAPIANTSVDIGNQWKLYYASGKAPKVFAPGTARVTLHLAAAKHVVDLGPVFVLDFGQGHDPAKLPKN